MIDLDAIAAGLSAGEFYLEYLPTVMLADERCIGAEALVRWRRPSGVVQPQEFIPIVENTHLAGLMTYWVIETAAKELGDWLRAHDDIHLAINVPPEIVGRGGLEYASVKAGLKGMTKKIVLELTERGVPDKMGVEALAKATRRGVRVALDDVSLDGANMVVLLRCHAEIIKLDRAVVAELAQPGPPPGWLAGLTSLLRTTKLTVIAEGVESADQAALLRTAGVEMAQGYYFSPPLSAKAFVEFFQARR
jgi:sensor c-di-GMP phosphodiesterase-like protein